MCQDLDTSSFLCKTKLAGSCLQNPGKELHSLLGLRANKAERLGFEPRVPVRVRRISSAVHSTTLASLRLQVQRYNKI